VEPRDLSVSQAAMLAAMPSAPNDLRIDLAQNLERAHSRREWVLARMSDEGYLTAAALDQASTAPLR
jgi:membrane peptidoglycan carboxypeptidase